MSFDLQFCDSAGLDAARIDQAMAQVVGPLATRAAGGNEWTYSNPATHVRCTFRLGPSGLGVEVPYIRPRFFGVESLLMACALCDRLGLKLPDPRAQGRADASPVAPDAAIVNMFVEQWIAGNRWAIGSAHRLTGQSPPYLEPDRSMYWWRYQRCRPEIKAAVQGSAIVPEAMMVRSTGDGGVMLVADWTNGFPSILPVAEIYFLVSATGPTDPNPAAAWTPGYKVFDALGPIMRRVTHDGIDVVACSGVPPMGPIREAFDALPRGEIVGAFEAIDANFVDEQPEQPASV